MNFSIVKLSLICSFLSFLFLGCGSEQESSADSLPKGDNPYTDFREKNFDGEDFTGFAFTGSNFSNASLEGTNFSNGQLSGTVFHGANLSYAQLDSSDLTNADLNGAQLQKADLRNANLTSANLSNSNLAGVLLSGANLTGVKFFNSDLSKVEISQIDFKNALTDGKTTWPEGFDPVGAEMIIVESLKFGGGGTIAYQHDLDGDWDISLIDSERTFVEQITDDDNYNFHPQLSPDGKSILLISDREGQFPGVANRNFEIYVISKNALTLAWEKDPSSWQRLTNNKSQETDPVWSPDASQIAFTRRSFNENDELKETAIYKMNADGSDEIRLTLPSEYAMHPAWSPDGSKIAYSSGELKDRQITILDLETMETEKASFKTQLSSEPSWSPNNDEIVFIGYSSDTQESGLRLLTNNDEIELTNWPSGIRNSMPTWSPDGSIIIFRYISGGASYIAQIDRDGKNLSLMKTSAFTETLDGEIKGGAPGNWVSD